MGHHRQVAGAHLDRVRTHALGEHALSIWRDRLVVGRDEIPGRMRFPGGHPHHVLKGAHRQALLNGPHDLSPAPLDVGCEVGDEVLFRQPRESLLVDDQMGQGRRRGACTEQSAKRFALV